MGEAITEGWITTCDLKKHVLNEDLGDNHVGVIVLSWPNDKWQIMTIGNDHWHKQFLMVIVCCLYLLCMINIMFTISKNNEDRVVGVKKKMYTLVKRRQRDWKLKCGFVRSEDWMNFEWWINLNVSASNSYSFNYIMSMLSSWKTSMIQIEFWNLSFERLNCINILALHNELDLFLFIFSLGHLHLFTMSAARFSFNLMLVHHV